MLLAIRFGSFEQTNHHNAVHNTKYVFFVVIDILLIDGFSYFC